MEPIITRFAPSPTGFLHLGGARTALFNYLFSRHHGGTFILRIEDTDRTRSTDEYIQDILGALSWLGISWDEGPFYQSERIHLHRELADRLLSENKAYRCYCTPETLEEKRKASLQKKETPRYDGACRDRKDQPDLPFAIRFRTPRTGVTAFTDLIRGQIQFSNSELDDLILVRRDGMPTYNFSVVVDDATMNITHIIRGDDHINNTPRQILLYQALGFRPPLFAHVPMIHGADRTRLSKRHGATAVLEYRNSGYLPEALVNYLVRLGWGHGDQEIFSPDELVQKFELRDVSKSAAVFNPEKLSWLNHQYLMRESSESLLNVLKPFLHSELPTGDREHFLTLLELLKPRAKTLTELAEQARFFFVDEIDLEAKAAEKFLKPEIRNPLLNLAARLKDVPGWSEEELDSTVREFAQESGIKLGKLAQPIRLALTGRTESPGLFEIMTVLGKEKSLQRIESVIQKIARE